LGGEQGKNTPTLACRQTHIVMHEHLLVDVLGLYLC